MKGVCVVVFVSLTATVGCRGDLPEPGDAGSPSAQVGWITLHKITGDPGYLEVAIGIADTLARNARPGDEDHSPWPYRVHFETGTGTTGTTSGSPMAMATTCATTCGRWPPLRTWPRPTRTTSCAHPTLR